MLTKQEKLKFISSIKKETDIHELLYELLPEMGFSDVLITHEKGNEPEYGKDLICSKIDDLENKKDWYAFVVKKDKLSGKTGAVKDVEDQVFECFKYPYKSIEQKRKIPINKVKVVTNEHISAGAKKKIFEGNSNDEANIDFWTGTKLIKFIDKFYPAFWVQGSKQYKKYVEKFQNRIRTDSLSKAIGIDDKKIEKLFDSIIEPKIIERTKEENGDVKWVEKKIKTIVSLETNSFIVGEAGSGKTTFFKDLAMEIITQNTFRNNAEFYPIIITFRELKDSNFDLIKTIENYFSKDWNNELNINFLKILKSAQCCVFIDALDELAINEDKDKAIKAINRFHSEFESIKIVCSSRPSDFLFYNCEEVGFKYLEINPLLRSQVETFINSYFSGEEIKSKRLLKSLKDTGILSKLPKTPLTIALITILYDENEVEIPATITDLYSNFVDLLLGKYKPASTIDILEIGAKHRLLCFIAKELHSNNIKNIPSQKLLISIKEYAEERGHKIDYSTIIDDIINNTGLLVRDSRDEIQFKHLSFQEYFTAYEIFHHRQADRKILVDNFHNLWWQNVCIFYAGLSKDSPDLITEIITKNKPKDLKENILHIGGMGKLLQALYNTPITERKQGLNSSTKSLSNILKLVEGNPNNPEIIFWQNFSRYGIMQIYCDFFAHNHWSITLVEPMKQIFTENFSLEEGNFYSDLELYIISAILGSDDFQLFSYLKQFVGKQKIDLSLLALSHSNLDKLYKRRKDLFKSNNDLRLLNKKVLQKIRKLGAIQDLVNTPINKLIESKSR